MNLRYRVRRAAFGLIAAASFAAALLTAADRPVQARAAGGAKGLEGVWAVQVTRTDCATGAPLGPPFLSLVTFVRGGTIVESSGGTSFAPGQRSSGHGTWSHEGGNTYTQQMIGLIRFTTLPGPGTPGFEAGWQTVRHTVTRVDRNHIVSSGANAFYDSNGQLYRSGCSTAEGERFE